MKRLFDIFAATILLVLLAPLAFVVAALVRIRLGSPVLFRQMRGGWNNTTFELLKFRTMTCEQDGEGRLLSDELRLTRLGRFLRASSLDELPQLINVLRGEMSLVGPRPLMASYIERYSHEQKRRHEVRPGITGWTQVKGRNSLDWDQKFQLDVWYVDRCSWILDMKILWLTLVRLARPTGITADGHVTMPEFRGSVDNLNS